MIASNKVPNEYGVLLRKTSWPVDNVGKVHSLYVHVFFCCGASGYRVRYETTMACAFLLQCSAGKTCWSEGSGQKRSALSGRGRGVATCALLLLNGPAIQHQTHNFCSRTKWGAEASALFRKRPQGTSSVTLKAFGAGPSEPAPVVPAARRNSSASSNSSDPHPEAPGDTLSSCPTFTSQDFHDLVQKSTKREESLPQEMRYAYGLKRIIRVSLCSSTKPPAMVTRTRLEYCQGA